jgi:hypothetical protein
MRCIGSAHGEHTSRCVDWSHSRSSMSASHPHRDGTADRSTAITPFVAGSVPRATDCARTRYCSITRRMRTRSSMPLRCHEGCEYARPRVRPVVQPMTPHRTDDEGSTQARTTAHTHARTHVPNEACSRMEAAVRSQWSRRCELKRHALARAHVTAPTQRSEPVHVACFTA